MRAEERHAGTYATTGPAKQLFVSKYRVNLPSGEELQALVREEQERLGS